MADQTPELPTTEHVRFIYSLDGADYVEPDYREYKAQEFDQWHASEIAAAEQRGAARGWDRGFYESKNHDHVWEEDPPNPYRADQMEGDE